MLACSACDSFLITHLPNVRYLTGFSGSAGTVLITPRQKLFFTDSRYRLQAAKQVKGYGVRIVPGDSLEGCARYAVSRRLKLGVAGYEAGRLSHKRFLLLRRILRGVNLRDASGIVEKLRLVKSRAEQAKIRRACRIADAALAALTRQQVTGKSEEDVAWFLESVMRKGGSGALPFVIIVASGPRSAMPHGAATGRVIRKGELVVVDMGASVDGYCCDITRTFATGPLPARLKQIYNIVREAQELALNGVRPGAPAAEPDRVARGHIKAAGYGREFGHSLGHGVGLEAHEGPWLAARSRDTLAAGMTVTVEPGLYIEDQGGVRIEDTVLVGSRSPLVLTSFPRQLTLLR